MWPCHWLACIDCRIITQTGRLKKIVKHIESVLPARLESVVGIWILVWTVVSLGWWLINGLGEVACWVCFFAGLQGCSSLADHLITNPTCGCFTLIKNLQWVGLPMIGNASSQFKHATHALVTAAWHKETTQRHSVRLPSRFAQSHASQNAEKAPQLSSLCFTQASCHNQPWPTEWYCHRCPCPDTVRSRLWHVPVIPRWRVAGLSKMMVGLWNSARPLRNQTSPPHSHPLLLTEQWAPELHWPAWTVVSAICQSSASFSTCAMSRG